jgi:hypothetical protein
MMVTFFEIRTQPLDCKRLRITNDVGSGSEVSAMKSLLKKDSDLSIENGSFKGFALLSTR